jgi:2-isopropylmalate synthase
MKNIGKHSLETSHGMQKAPITKYRPFPPIDLPDRQWPTRTIVSAPIWCSVDLRDGNQALPTPMGIEEKLEMFKLLVGIGFKEIEVGFPSASPTEFEFVRRLIEEGHVPDDVRIQVLAQAREELILRTFEALRGAKNVIFHLYNSTNELQRRLVFGLDKPDIIAIATRGTQLVKDLLPSLPDTNMVFEYSPESFALTEVEFALEICEAVVEVWQPTPEKKIILNLPETVEIATPNVHADQIEWMSRHLSRRDAEVISLHTHNDRGTGVAAAELGLLAGAERVEGTLFGNGERTGNVDIITLALNMYMQGIDPGLDFSDIKAIREVYEKCTRMSVPERWPYGGELVFTAFSGSHQDAIRKGMAAQERMPNSLWEVPYLPIDPQDISCTYEAIIRINSQSGKGGVAYILERDCGLQMPKEMQVEFGKVIKAQTDASGEELPAHQLLQIFESEYLDCSEIYHLEHLHMENIGRAEDQAVVSCTARLRIEGVPRTVQGQGNGPIDAFVQGLNQSDLASFQVLSYTEHSLGEGSDARAAAYVQIQTTPARKFFGASVETNSELAAIKAVLSALNRSALVG